MRHDVIYVIDQAAKGVSAPLKGKYLHWTGGEADSKAHMVFEQWRVNT
jgi:hypothetical protein